jgi:hypothetical protein
LDGIEKLSTFSDSFSMCFSAEMSAFYALVCFGLGGIVYAAGRSKRLAISMGYFGLMELLQTVQYWFVAKPEDNYAMCQSPTNQFLTFLGLLHILFQPYFCNMAFCAPLRPGNLHIRYMNDMVLRLCLLFAGWMFGRYWWAVYWPDNPDMAARPSEACPNYEWIRDGYDSGIGWTTPNLPGHSCTFLANTETRHIAWAVPLYQATYFVPGVSIHAFLMFAPALAIFMHIPIAVVFFLSGPLLAAWITPSMNEQASVWCYHSVFQCIAYTIIAFVTSEANPPAAETVDHQGSLFGELPMEYRLVVKESSGANGHANGDKKHH